LNGKIFVNPTIVVTCQPDKQPNFVAKNLTVPVILPMDKFSIAIRNRYSPVTASCSQCLIFPIHILKCNDHLPKGVSHPCLLCLCREQPFCNNPLLNTAHVFTPVDNELLSKFFDVFRFTKVESVKSESVSISLDDINNLKLKSIRAQNSPHPVEISRLSTNYRKFFYYEELTRRDHIPLWRRFISTFDPTSTDYPKFPLF
jgi:hypothetical protein